MKLFKYIRAWLKSIRWSMRSVVLWVIFIILVILLWFIYQRINVFPLEDFIEYWSSGRIALERGNPYDRGQMLQIEQSAGWLINEPLMMLNPPWVLPYTIFFGAFIYPLSRLICFLFQIIVICWSGVNVWKTYGGMKKDEWIAWLVVLTFGPLLQAIKFGQISILVLFGCAGFLILINKKNDFFAGMMASLVLVKPQLLYLFILTILFWSIYTCRFRVLLGIALSILGSLAITLLFTPNIISQYLEMMKEYPLNLWMTSTLGASLRGLIGEEKYYLQFVPSIFGFLWLCVYLYRSRKVFDWHKSLPLIVLVSIATSSYGWIFDYSVLVISVFPIAVIFYTHKLTVGKILIFFTYWVANLSVIFLSTSQNWFWWFPSFLLVWYLLSNRYLGNLPGRSVTQNMLTNP